jgi:formylglycine-generating enzyme required for sulfatase activity
MPTPPSSAAHPSVFLSYSHKDERWKERLLTHLGIAAEEGLLAVWDDRRIAAGDEWREEIRRAIDAARVAILLVSADFLTSRFVRDEEVPRCLERRSEDELRVFPVIVRDCDWRIVPWLAPLQIRPRGARPLAGFQGNDRDRELTAIAREVREILRRDGTPGRSPEGRPPAPGKRAATPAPEREEQLPAVAAAAPDQSLLDFWMQQVASDHERLVPLQGQVELGLLERVYVQLDLRPDLRPDPRPAGEPAAEARLPGPLTLPDLLALDRREHPWVTGRWTVLGDPGAGKTTVLRHLAADLARRPDRRWLPLFESLPRLLRGSDSLPAHVARRLERAGYPAHEVTAALDRTAREGRLLLLLDGLDEVPRKDREEAEQLLRDLASSWPAAPLVVASRPIGYHRPGSEFREVDLLPLDREHRRELLVRWFGRAAGTQDAARADRAVLALDAPELREVAGNPLYLTLLALLFEQGIEPDRNRTRLYDQVFGLLLDGKHRKEARPMERKDVVRAVLRRLALGMTEDNRDAEPVEALEERLYRPELDPLRKKLEQVPRWRDGLRPLLDELAEQTGILGPHDGDGADWRFWHRTFREALAAESLWDEYREKGGRAAVLARAARVTVEEDLGRWAEPYALLAGLAPDPDDLVRALVEQNRPLGLRALATAQRLRGETLREVLALSEKWEERAEVYRNLPDLVGEGRRALALLDRIRRRTRNGNDLYFLDLAIREVGRRFPEQAGEAAALTAGLYDHFPRPPEELFRWVETPLAGRVKLWCDIPAGRFWMGSTEKEDGYSKERPRHEVTIAAPFRFGAVPVTNAQYAAFDPGHEPRVWEGVTPEELPYHPVVTVTWYEAVSFCRWLAATFPWARGARLPVEAEWEYACRAGTTTRYWKGDEEKDLDEVGWYRANSGDRTHRVGEKPANPWGLYDVHGNVWEWTLSPRTDSYAGREVTVDPATAGLAELAEEAPSGAGRVSRGGGFWNDAVNARAAYRFFWYPGIVNQLLGFRVALPAFPEPRR